MSFDWTSQPLSIQSIVSQYTLPVAIRSAPGFRGSNRPIILHSIQRVTFAFGRALRAIPSPNDQHSTYTPIDSEVVAIPINYPGYFECLPSSNSGQPYTGIAPETSIQSIVDRMQMDHRSQAFFMTSPIRVFTLEPNDDGIINRVWHNIEAYQVIIFEKLMHVQYTPSVDDDLNDDDYAYSWWFCFGKQIVDRNELVLQCLLHQQQNCYIPCSYPDEVDLIPVGQPGSTNSSKLQAIQNLLDRFPIPINIKLAQLPGSYAFNDFSGCLQLLGSRVEEFAICGSLTTPNIAAIPKNTPLKFIVSPISSLSSQSSQIRNVLTSCHAFSKSFEMQIRRILISSYSNNAARRSRLRNAKSQPSTDDQNKKYKRSFSEEFNSNGKEDHTTTDEGYRSSSSAVNKRNFRKNRAISVDVEGNSQGGSHKRRGSTDEDTKSDSRNRSSQNKRESSPTKPPPLPKKPPNFPFAPVSSISDFGTNLIDDIDAGNADGAVLMDTSNELFLALPSDSRFT